MLGKMGRAPPGGMSSDLTLARWGQGTRWHEQVVAGLPVQCHRWTLLGERHLTLQKMISGRYKIGRFFILISWMFTVSLGGISSPPLLKLFLIKLVYDLRRGQARKGMDFVVVSRVFLL